MSQTDQAARERAVTDAVVASFAGAPDARYREVMTSLVEHLHAFVRDVRLTPPWWSLFSRLLHTWHMFMAVRTKEPRIGS